MKCHGGLLLLLLLFLSVTLRTGDAQCILDIGTTTLSFLINCVIRKSVLFRVRNLGGVKGYVDVGLSVGDSIGFTPSEIERRRQINFGRNQRWANKKNVSLSITAAKKNGTQTAAAPDAFRSVLAAANNRFQTDPRSATTGHGSVVTEVKRFTIAPREYHPMGYKRNSTNTEVMIEMRKSSFNCKEQKHFPGLYADRELGCRVFRACLMTDSGIVMKSFLCPESTLFDQSILRCNWWFYVDCKTSNKLYDSNLPISKSYQLTKALAFSVQPNKQNETSENVT